SVPSWVCASRQNTQRSLQRYVSRTQLRWSCAASSCSTSLSVAHACCGAVLPSPSIVGPEGSAVVLWSATVNEMLAVVVHPPLSVARDFIDYPYFSDLGAVQLAAVLRAQGPTALVDAFALPGAELQWRDDGRARL